MQYSKPPKVLTRMHRGYYSVNRTVGLSLMEMVITVGIIAIMAVIGSIAYMEHVNITGKLAALQKLGSEALEEMQKCMELSVLNTGKESFRPVDNNSDGDTDDPGEWRGCDTLEKLNLQDCQECDTPKAHATWKTICMEMNLGRFKQCVAYRLGEQKWITHWPLKVSINHKVCVKRYHSKGAVNVSAVWPYQPCDSVSDCDTGLECTERKGLCDVTIVGFKGGCY